MAGLLDFALGFGAGAAGGFVEQKKADLEAQRQANLARLQAQYKGEAEYEQARRVGELVSSGKPEDLATAIALGYKPPTEGGMTDAMRNLNYRIAQRMASTPGMSRERATQIELGQISTGVDPVTGALYERTIGAEETSARAVNVQREGIESVATPIPDLRQEDVRFDPAQAVGFPAVAKKLWNDTLGQIPLLPTFLAPESVAQQLIILERDAIRMLSTSSKPPVIEQERIGRLFPEPFKLLSNPETARLKVLSGVEMMALQRRDDLMALQDPNLSAKTREELRSRTLQAESIIKRVLTEEAANEYLKYGISQTESGEQIVTLDRNTDRYNTFKGVFEIQRQNNEIPQIPTFVLEETQGNPAEFLSRLGRLGFKSGDYFQVPGKQDFYRVP